MDWDDLRFVIALAKSGSLAKTAKVLAVDHTTVGRRVASAEAALGVRLFTRTTTGYVATTDADRLLGPMKQVEESVLAVERTAQARSDRLEGALRVTAPETFGAAYLAPRLASFGRANPGLSIEIVPSGEVLDLGRREAEIAVRLFRSKQENLVARRGGAIGYGLYASHAYLADHPLKTREALAHHTILSTPGEKELENVWLRRLCPAARPSFTSTVSLALQAAARASAGAAVLPRYLGDRDAALRYLPMPEEPSEPIWLTVHRDLKRTPRVRALLDYLAATLEEDAALLRGARTRAG